MSLARAVRATEQPTSPAATPSTHTPHVPLRTCVGCRGRGQRSSLLRIVLDEDGASLALDSRKTMPGRGAWLHPDATCLQQATTRRAWGRALKLRTPVHTQQLHDVLVDHLSTLSPTGDVEPHLAASDDHDRKRV